MAKSDHPVKIQSGDVADALRAALSIPKPEDAIEGAKQDWEKEKSGGAKKGRPRSKKNASGKPVEL